MFRQTKVGSQVKLKVVTYENISKRRSHAAADISTQYLVRYESEAEKPLRPEVKVKRKDVRVRPGLAEIAH